MKRPKFEEEFMIHASPQMLFNYISTAEGLGEWFADKVMSEHQEFVFIWDNTEEKAILIKSKHDRLVRFQWDDDANSDYYFQLEIQVDEITKDVSLLVTDFLDDEDDFDETLMFWENKISDLKHTIGSE